MPAWSLLYSPRSVPLSLQPGTERSSTTYNKLYVRVFGYILSPDHLRRKTTRPVSYYALFKWWLPLSQHPGCLCSFTSFKPLRIY